MRKTIAIVLAVLLALSMCACGKKSESAPVAAETTAAPSAAPAGSGKADSAASAQPAESEEKAPASTPAKTENAAQSSESKKTPEVPAVLDTAFLAGTWTAGVDITDQLTAGMIGDETKELFLSLGVEDFEQFVSIRPATLYVELLLNEDGSFSRSIDSDSVQFIMENFSQDIIDTFVRALESAFRMLCEESEITLEELYAESGVSDIYELIELVLGMTLDEYKESIIETETPKLEESLVTFNVSGNYSVSGNSLTFNHDGTSDAGSFNAENGSISLSLGVDMQFYR